MSKHFSLFKVNRPTQERLSARWSSHEFISLSLLEISVKRSKTTMFVEQSCIPSFQSCIPSNWGSTLKRKNLLFEQILFFLRVNHLLSGLLLTGHHILYPGSCLPFNKMAKQKYLEVYPFTCSPTALRKAKIVYNFGLSECSRFKNSLKPHDLFYFKGSLGQSIAKIRGAKFEFNYIYFLLKFIQCKQCRA